jgi:acylphosphatase
MTDLNIKIFGQVQGVFFRGSAKQKAQDLGITGFVRNVLGAVYIEAEGSEEALEQFLGWCRHGPAQRT